MTRSLRAPFWSAALAGAAFSAAANVVLFVAAAPLLAAGEVPATVHGVAALSAAGSLAGSAVFALLRRVATDPVRAFRNVSLAVLLVSFLAPFALPSAGAATLAVLCLAHTAVVFGTVWLLTAAPGTASSFS
jgi:fumarate reductase subunit D